MPLLSGLSSGSPPVAELPPSPGLVVWLTGLVGAGKTTLARATARRLAELGHSVTLLDGDELRHGASADLGFGRDDRRQNVRRAARLAAGHAAGGGICLVALIAPFAADRAEARLCVGPGRYVEAHVSAPLAVCEQRDPKGLYARARAGELSALTGIDDPYEEPLHPEVLLPTHLLSVGACVERLVEAILPRCR